MELKAPATAPAPRLEEQPLDPLGPLTLIPDEVTGPAAGVFGRVVCLVPRRVLGLTEGTEGKEKEEERPSVAVRDLAAFSSVLDDRAVVA